MRLKEFKLFLLGAVVGAGALLVFALSRSGASQTRESPGKRFASVETPPVALLAIGVFLAALVLFFGWRPLERQRQTTAVAKALTHGDAASAPRLMIRYGCAGCHTIDGVPGADGKVGPALSGLVHRVYIGGTAPNTPDNLVRWIVDPEQFSPHSAMPPPGLAPAEARDIAAYLYAH
jgi:cytochrome c